ncbi:MAG: papain-like cysteine protease family protein [Thermoanaerobaculia bacterium]
MALQKTRFRRLGFDPTVSESENGRKNSFEWAIDHENQEEGDWCWAACLRSSLTAFGFFAHQKEIVARFQTDHHTAPNASDQRIPSAEDVVALWRSYGFHGAFAQEMPLELDALVKELVTRGPVQIELWKEGRPKDSHLVLIVGVAEQASGNGHEILVSDPAAQETIWYPYDRVRGENPLPSGFGEWRRTYTGLEFEGGYLRRFFGCPSKYLAGLDLDERMATDGAEPPPVPLVDSRLSFGPVPDPDPPLTRELSLATYGYRHYRARSAKEDERGARREDLRLRLFLFESIQVWRPRRGADLDRSLGDQIDFYRWHHQIHDAQGPRYYAEAFHFPQLSGRLERSWRTTWIGERWMAERVHDAIRTMDAGFGDREETARLVLFRREGLVTLLLPQRGIHMVVSAPRRLEETTFPLLKVYTDEELREALAGAAHLATAAA